MILRIKSIYRTRTYGPQLLLSDISVPLWKNHWSGHIMIQNIYHTSAFSRSHSLTMENIVSSCSGKGDSTEWGKDYVCSISYSEIQEGERIGVLMLRAVSRAHAIQVTPPCSIAPQYLPSVVLVLCPLSVFQTVASFNRGQLSVFEKQGVHTSQAYNLVVQTHFLQHNILTVTSHWGSCRNSFLCKIYLLMLHVTLDAKLKFVCVCAASVYLVIFLRASCCSHCYFIPVLCLCSAASSKWLCAKSGLDSEVCSSSPATPQWFSKPWKWMKKHWASSLFTQDVLLFASSFTGSSSSLN